MAQSGDGEGSRLIIRKQAGKLRILKAGPTPSELHSGIPGNKITRAARDPCSGQARTGVSRKRQDNSRTPVQSITFSGLTSDEYMFPELRKAQHTQLTCFRYPAQSSGRCFCRLAMPHTLATMNLT